MTSRIVKVHESAGTYLISISKEVPGANEFEEAVARESREEILFSLHLPTDVIFFRGELRKGEADFFNIRIKGSVYKVQRRGTLRLSLPRPVPVQFKAAGGSPFSGELLNLSEGGIAVSFREKSEFETVTRPNEAVQLTFTAFGISVIAEATFRHGSEVGSAMVKKTYRVGFFFTQIDPKVRTQLSQLVFEESSKYLGRI